MSAHQHGSWVTGCVEDAEFSRGAVAVAEVRAFILHPENIWGSVKTCGDSTKVCGMAWSQAGAAVSLSEPIC